MRFSEALATRIPTKVTTVENAMSPRTNPTSREDVAREEQRTFCAFKFTHDELTVRTIGRRGGIQGN